MFGTTWEVLRAGVVRAKQSQGVQYGLQTTSGGELAHAAMGVPAGIDWMTDTRHGLDIYTKGFAKTPTLFFDPSATTSANIGTLRNPYNTLAALMAVVSGNMTGQTIGFRRGTTLRITTPAVLRMYGSSSDPVTLCPYGDALALPIITGGKLISVTGDIATGWKQLPGSTTIWYYTMGATEHDVWQDNVRLWKMTWNTDAPTTLTVEGTATYNANTIYIRPYGGASADLSNVEISCVDYTLQPVCSDVAATGNIVIAGLDVRKSRINTMNIGVTGLVSTTSVANISVVGCKIGQAGANNTLSLGRDALLIYGPTSDTIRASGVYVAGNELYDCINNCAEFGSISGAIMEHNYCHHGGGHGLELWKSCANVTARYNHIHHMTTYDADRGISYLTPGMSGRGFWINNLLADGVTNDNANTYNANVLIHHNLMTDVRNAALRCFGGTGHKFVHNTKITNPANVAPAGSISTSLLYGWYTQAGTAGTTGTQPVPNAGFLEISNNLFYWHATTPSVTQSVRYGCIGTNLGASAAVPTGDKNVYLTAAAIADAAPDWQYNGIGVSNFTTYKTTLSGYSLDQNSLARVNVGANITSAQLAMDESTYKPGPSSSATNAGITTLTGIGTRYQDGAPYTASACTIGALLGS